MNKIFKKVIDIVFIIIIIVLSGYFILRLTGNIDLYEVKTGSMEPAIKTNDYILIYKSDNYKKGDIVTFEFDNSLVTHRIVKINKNKIVTKGDANNTNDDEIDVSSVIGKVFLSGGILNIIINFKYAIIAFMLALYLLTCYLDDSKKEQGDKNEKEKERDRN